MQIVVANAEYPNDGPLARSCLGFWNLTGASEGASRPSLEGSVELTGDPVSWKRQGALVDGSNSLSTTLAGGRAIMTLADVFFRDLTTCYMGNFDNNGPSDSLLESSGVSPARGP